MSFMRATTENRPLVQNSPSIKSLKKDGWTRYVNEDDNYDADKMISSKFGESCWKALTPVLDNRKKDFCAFNKKKYFLRETSSGKSNTHFHHAQTRCLFPRAFYFTANSSPKITAASRMAKKRVECMSQREQDELREFAWFQAGIPREISLEVLLRKNPGEFLVRESSTKPGCFALSLRVPPPGPKVAHYLIVRTSRGYKIKGFNKEFSTLRALITHHSVMPEQLPVPLELPRPANYHTRRRNLDDMYGSLSDFQDLILQTWAEEQIQNGIAKKFLWLELDGRHRELVKNSVRNSWLHVSSGLSRIGDKLLQVGQMAGIQSDWAVKPSYL